MGLTPTNYTKENTLRSAMESGIYGLKLGLESFTKLGFKAKEIKLIGGGAKSRLWRQMAADIFDLPIVCPQEEEAAAFGAALQALWSHGNYLGRRSNLNRLLAKHVVFSKEKKHKPLASAVKLYRKSYEKYKEYVGAVSPIFN